jgi:glycine/D-amino acid oxidase-like deaminating enzyme
LYPFYQALEQKVSQKLIHPIPLWRKFYSVEEQNNWFIAADKPNLAPFLDANLIHTTLSSIESPYAYGHVMHTGYVDTGMLLESYKAYLKMQQCFREETFAYDLLEHHDEDIVYKDIRAKNIVFAEGFGLLSNPYFNTLPLDGTKGEVLVIHAPKLQLEVIVKSSIFIMPIGKDYYKVGATYNWVDKTNIPTLEAKNELLTQLKELIQCDFTLVEHLAGVRPTVKDRRPLVGRHPLYKNMFILNGLGTRGVMLAPAMARDLFNYIENDVPLDPYIDIKRVKRFVSSFCHNG